MCLRLVFFCSSSKRTKAGFQSLLNTWNVLAKWVTAISQSLTSQLRVLLIRHYELYLWDFNHASTLSLGTDAVMFINTGRKLLQVIFGCSWKEVDSVVSRLIENTLFLLLVEGSDGKG